MLAWSVSPLVFMRMHHTRICEVDCGGCFPDHSTCGPQVLLYNPNRPFFNPSYNPTKHLVFPRSQRKQHTHREHMFIILTSNEIQTNISSPRTNHTCHLHITIIRHQNLDSKDIKEIKESQDLTSTTTTHTTMVDDCHTIITAAT